MGWNYEDSLERVERAYSETANLTVGEVARETDLENTTLTKPRKIKAAHFYVDVTNYRDHLVHDPVTMPDSGVEAAGGENLLHRSHLWARELSRIVKLDFDAAKVHFQGPKLHGLAYRPVGDDEAMVVKAVLTAAAIRATVKVFAEELELDTDPSWHTAAGVDFGTALVTKDGARGDRELLFLGTPANQAAKILSKGLRISATVRDLLPESFSSWITTTSDPGVYAIAINADHLEDLVKAHGYSWSRQRSRERLQKALESYPPGSATVHTATGAIDKDVLGMSNTKRVNAVSIFADVDGFTSYIARADMLGTLPEAVRAYHAIRYEMRQTIVSDYDGLRVQYQGDRIQGLAYLPISDEQAAAVGAVKVAAALHSAVAEVLPQVIGAEAAKPLAIGLAAGAVMVSKLGEHGNRDVVSLGLSTADAARIQERLPGWHTGIDTSLHNRLPAWLAELFKWDAAACAYVASDLKLDEVERAEAQAGMEPATSSARASTRRASAVVGAAEPLRPYLMRD